MGDAVQDQSVKARIKQHHLHIAAGRGVPLKDGLDLPPEDDQQKDDPQKDRDRDDKDDVQQAAHDALPEK
jgi:hypothetical protein